jgi:hypothetical protein
MLGARLASVLLLGGALTLALVAREGTAKDPERAGPAPVGSPLDARLLAGKPQATLLLVGRNQGKLKPCGCSAPQTGGLLRMATCLDLLRERAGGALVTVSVGWIMAPHTASRVEQAQSSLKAMLVRQVALELDFGAQLLGPHDLYVPEMVAAFGGPGQAHGAQQPTLPLNMRPTALVGVDPAAAPLPWVDLRVRSQAVRALSVLDEGQGEMLRSSGLAEIVIPPATALQQALNPAPGTLFVVAVDGGASVVDGVRAAMRGLGPCVIVDMSGATSDAARERVNLADGPLVVGFDEKGKQVGVLDIEPSTGGKGLVVSYVAQPLGPEFEAEGTPTASRQEVASWFEVYKQQVQERNLLAMEERREEGPGDPRFVGSAACAECHQGIYQEWAATPHARALRTLKREAYAWDPECLVCHVQGPERHPKTGAFTWWKSGFTDVDQTPHLGGVGCENCHGPGSTHVADPTNRALWYAGGRLVAKPTRAECVRCHDVENSVGFSEQFPARLPKVDHSRVPKERRTHAPRPPR